MARVLTGVVGAIFFHPMGEGITIIFSTVFFVVRFFGMNTQLDFTPNFLRLAPTKDRLTSAAGRGSLIESFDQSPLNVPFAASLPERVSHRSQGAYRLGLIQVAHSQTTTPQSSSSKWTM